MTLFQLKSVSTFRLPSPRRPIYPFVVLALMVAIGFLWASQVQSGMDLRPILRLAAAASLLLALILAWNARLQNLYQALRESERSKSVLLANLPGMAYQCRCDPQWTMEFISEGCKELTGHPCEDLLYNRKLSFNDLIEPSFREDLWKAWQAAIDTGKSVQVEYPIRAADGSMKWVYEQSTPIRDAEGHVKFLEGLIIDITPRKTIEQELVAARRKAEDALRVKARFLAVMSHEIRTPLNGILGLSDMLLGNAADPEKARELRMIQESGRHLLHIINDILEFSHMDSGKVQLEVQAFSLTSLVENLRRTFAPLARQKGLSFSLEVGASIPERFLGDENRLRQVMTNLIANAIKFTERGSVEVRVEGVPGSVPEQWDLGFRVTDSGIGISESHQEIIFDEFVQADSATHRKYGGSGLGLAISRQIVHAMQGRIELQSVPGQGSEFCVTLSLPLAPPESSAGSHTGPSLSSLTFSSKAYHILVVEDHFINREVAKAVLSKMGLRVSTAESGMEALDFLHSTRPDLILMDLEMPGMDGCETTRLIRGREREHGGQAPPIPILAMTAHDLPLFQERCKEAGMDDILPKPIDPCVLFPVLHRFLEFNSPTYCSTPEPP